MSQNIHQNALAAAKNRFGISPQPRIQSSSQSISQHPLLASSITSSQPLRQTPATTTSNTQNSSFTRYFSGTSTTQSNAASAFLQQQQQSAQQTNISPQIVAFTIKILEGRLALANSSDLRPFVQIQFNKKIWRTSVHKGSYPKWHEQRRFEIPQTPLNAAALQKRQPSPSSSSSASVLKSQFSQQIEIQSTPPYDPTLEIIVLHKTPSEDIELGRTHLNLLDDDIHEEWVCIQSNSGILGSVQVQLSFEYASNPYPLPMNKPIQQTNIRSQLKQNQIAHTGLDQGKPLQTNQNNQQQVQPQQSQQHHIVSPHTRHQNTNSEVIASTHSPIVRSQDLRDFFSNLVHEKELLLERQRSIQYRMDAAATENGNLQKESAKIEQTNSALKAQEAQLRVKKQSHEDKKSTFELVNEQYETNQQSIGTYQAEYNRLVEEENDLIFKNSKIKRQLQALRQSVPQLNEEIEQSTLGFYSSLQQLKLYKIKMLNDLSSIHAFISQQSTEEKGKNAYKSIRQKCGVDTITDFSVALKNVNLKIDYLTDVVNQKNAEIELVRDQIDAIQSHFDDS